ncbi:hypothetical protein ADK55_09570 [Streptomyces sp. WM4235]|uniref:DUF1707 SHOCT-like domain-containing protein n=1 Tax=unclassified Streptomyces TaxID=2593676 RepID=UPI0006C27657|nr:MULTISPECIES: DUF1707 domain-containing protein [unclassified Streptomyces]KOU60962.1 hypothetical protein ADK55_09570 [Streptomyces sp. WM4235]MCX5073608.1 DUF1707 domain-containing protein [Streptomyces sp. NBC_00424]MCX5154842.1 DUF1707 domain-containing protein [Streptomyces sp. NBC_00291]WUD43153.1 DUF1707 domain-containing protein [Streptomyces sp. NBC_00513]
MLVRVDLEKHTAAPAASAAAPAAELRASDADRDRIAQILADAVAEGRLTAEEHSDRLDTLYAVKTVGELDVLVRDLPAVAGSGPASATPVAAPASGPVETVVAVFSSSSRRGRWRPGAHTRAVSVFGDITIDLTEAVFEQQVTEINVTAVLGNVEVLVPENVTLRGYGSGVLGNFEVHGRSRGETDPQAPVVIVRGFALLANIEARPRLGARLVDLADRMRKRFDR